MKTNKERTAEAIKLVQKYVPEFKVVDKKDSKVHRLIGKFFKLIGNEKYMTSVWTTFGYQAARPEITDSWNEWQIILHEGWHAVQARKMTRLGFAAWYLAPQLLGIVGVLAAVLIALGTWSLWPLWGLLSAVLLAPIPALGRSRLELEAYKISAALDLWTWGHMSPNYPEWFTKTFNGPVYYWMDPRDSVRVKFLTWRARLGDGTWGLVVDGEYAEYLRDCQALAQSFRK